MGIFVKHKRETPDLIMLPEEPNNPKFYLSFHKISLHGSNTAYELDGTPYAGNKTWEQAVKLNLKLGKLLGKQQSIPSIADMRYLLYCLHENEVYDKNGNKLSSNLQNIIFNELTKTKNPWRGEWLGNKFVENNGILYVHSDHVFGLNESLTPVYNQPLEENALMKFKKIDLIDFILKHYTIQGFPSNNVKDGSLNYLNPVDKSVARFGAGSGGVRFGCSRYPEDSGSSLGWRAKFLEI